MDTEKQNKLKWDGPYTTKGFEEVICRKSQTLRVWAMRKALPTGVRIVQTQRTAPYLWFINWDLFLGIEEGE